MFDVAEDAINVCCGGGGGNVDEDVFSSLRKPWHHSNRLNEY
jgi:hypothetical protein